MSTVMTCTGHSLTFERPVGQLTHFAIGYRNLRHVRKCVRLDPARRGESKTAAHSRSGELRVPSRSLRSVTVLSRKGVRCAARLRTKGRVRMWGVRLDPARRGESETAGSSLAHGERVTGRATVIAVLRAACYRCVSSVILAICRSR